MLPIPGTKRPKYLLENVQAAAIELTPEDLAELDAMFPPGVAEGECYTEDDRIQVGT